MEHKFGSRNKINDGSKAPEPGRLLLLSQANRLRRIPFLHSMTVTRKKWNHRESKHTKAPASYAW